jgi:hypothetical protein
MDKLPVAAFAFALLDKPGRLELPDQFSPCHCLILTERWVIGSFSAPGGYETLHFQHYAGGDGLLVAGSGQLRRTLSRALCRCFSR